MLLRSTCSLAVPVQDTFGSCHGRHPERICCAQPRHEASASGGNNLTGPLVATVLVCPTSAGKRCKGEWTECTACAGCGNRTRTFIIPPGVEDVAAPVNASATGAAAASNTTRRLQAASSNGKGNSNNGHGKDRPLPSGRPSTIDAPTHGQQSQGQGLAQALGLGHALQGLALGKVECAVLNNTSETQPCTDTCPGYCAGAPNSAADNVTFVWQCGSGKYNGTSCAGTCSLHTPQADHSVSGLAGSLCSNGTYQSPSHDCTDI
jgi:hypothetical protein